MATYVLIPGAWHGGWAFRAVINHLRDAGHTAVALTMPGLGVNESPAGVTLQDAVDKASHFLESEDLRDVHLVGHSWGGMVLAGVAARAPERLSELVFYSAFVPEAGESLLDLCPPDYVGLFEALAAASPDNSVTLPLEVWQQGFMQDATAQTQSIVWEALSPHPMGAFRGKVDAPNYRELDIALKYVLSKDDIGLPEGPYGWVPRFPDRLGVAPVLTEGSHESLFTQPASVADGILA